MPGIEVIQDKRKAPKTGLVEYLVRWEGDDEGEEVWELRKELISQGFKDDIRQWENKFGTPHSSQRRQSMTSRRSSVSSRRRSTTNSDARGRTAARSARKSKAGRSLSPALSEAENEEEEEEEAAAQDKEDATEGSSSSSEGGEGEASSTSGKEGEGKGADDGDEGAGSSALPSFSEVSSGLGASLTVLTLSGLVAGSTILHLVLQAIMANGDVHHEEARVLVEWMLPATAVAPSFLSLYGLLSARGHSEPYAKWMAVTLVWITGAALLREMPHVTEAGGSVDATDVATGCVGIASTALTFAFAASDGREVPGIGALPLLLSFGGFVAPLMYALYAGVVELRVSEEHVDQAHLLVATFATLFAGMLAQALSRLGLGARSAFSRLSLPQWLGVAGAVFFTVGEGVLVCPKVGIALGGGDSVQKEEIETRGLPAHGTFHYTTQMTLYSLHVLAVVFLTASAVLARHRTP